MGSKELIIRHKGVMNIKSTNTKGDSLLISCGNEDDGSIKIWNILDRRLLNTLEEDEYHGKQSFYYLNVYQFKTVNGPKVEGQEDGYDEQLQGLMIIAAGINFVTMLKYQPQSQDLIRMVCYTQFDIGSYLASMTTLKHDADNLSVLSCNISGNVDVFIVKLDRDESRHKDSEVSIKLDKSAVSEHYGNVVPGVDIKALIEQFRNNPSLWKDEEKGKEADKNKAEAANPPKSSDRGKDKVGEQKEKGANNDDSGNKGKISLLSPKEGPKTAFKEDQTPDGKKEEKKEEKKESQSKLSIPLDLDD